MSDTLYETLKKAATDHAHAYNSPNPWNYDKVSSFRTPDCVQYLHPVEAMKAPFDQGLGLPQLKQALDHFGPVLDKCDFDVKEVAVDTRTRLVTARIQATFDFKAFGDEPAETGYMAEYIVMTEHDESGKVKRVEEFMNTDRLMGYIEPKASRYQAYVAGQSK